MDGVLIDSEPLWRRAEIERFADVGVALSEADCLETQGLRIDEAVAYWAPRRPWTGSTIETLAARIVDRMIELIRAEGAPMAGASASIEAARAQGWRLAVASSSSMRLIETVLDGFGWRARFEVLRSAEDEARGKPHPDVYVSAARDLGLSPARCLAIEDSANGVASARAAGMACVAVPPPETAADPRFEAATWRLPSLEGLPALLGEIADGPGVPDREEARR